MNRSIRSFALGAAVAAALFAGARVAAAHEYWLAPSPASAAPGTRVELGALAGTGFRGERKPFAAAHCRRLVVRTSRTLDLAAVARDGDYAWARFAPSDAGGSLFAFESDFTPITLPAPQFDAYLASEGLDAPLAARRAGAAVAGRERYRRCAKAWLAGGDAARATAPVGLPLEFVPMDAPDASARLRVRLLWQGRPLAGALIKAWRAPLGADGAARDPESRDSVAVAWQGRTNAQGETTLDTGTPGEWLLSAVHMDACAERAVADWESTWASFTFVRRAPARAVTR